MPRGVKGSGKPKVAQARDTAVNIAAAKTAPKKPRVKKAIAVESPVTTPVPEQLVTSTKPRKPYPTHEERLTAVDAQIARLTVLNTSRQQLIAQTEAKLNERKDALAKTQEALTKAQAKKARIVEAMNKPAKAPKLSPEERAEARKAALEKARAARAEKKAAAVAEQEKVAKLLEALKESGKSVDDLLSELTVGVSNIGYT